MSLNLTWKPDTSKQDAYSDQLVALLSDLGAEKKSGSVWVGGIEVYVECPYTGVDRTVTAVIVRNGHSRRANRHRFTKVQDQQHICKQIRKMVAEKAQNDSYRQTYLAKQAEYDARLVEAITVVRAAAKQTQQVRDLTAIEVTEHGAATYRFAFKVDGLTEAQALAIIEMVKGEQA